VPIFQLTRKEGRLYGLGIGNMKGALAAMCVVTAALHRHRRAWSGRLSMTAVSDEVLFGDRGSAALLHERRPGSMVSMCALKTTWRPAPLRPATLPMTLGVVGSTAQEAMSMPAFAR
jgi:hypothetical protein